MWFIKKLLEFEKFCTRDEIRNNVYNKIISKINNPPLQTTNNTKAIINKSNENKTNNNTIKSNNNTSLTYESYQNLLQLNTLNKEQYPKTSIIKMKNLLLNKGFID